jgi:26S proteasome regulatory subunit N6
VSVSFVKFKWTTVLYTTYVLICALSIFTIASRNAVALSQVILTARTLTAQAAKAKTAKLILTLINLFASLPESATEGKKGLTLILDEAITWARQTSRQHLAQSLSLSLASHHLAMKQYRAALTLLSQLTPELKRLDDKHLLTTIHLLSSLTYHRLHNLPKAKAELTSARTAAGSVYVGQGVQARLDLMSGVVNAEDGDWKTAYSYFFESFEGLCAVLEQEEKGGKGAMGDGFGGGGGSLVVDWGMAVGSSGGSGAGMQALTALKYMLLCKIMLNAVSRNMDVLNGLY